MTRRPSSLLLALVLCTLTACGLSSHSSPQAIPADELPADLLDPNPAPNEPLPQVPNASVFVYYLGQQDGVTRLLGVSRAVADPTSPAARINVLLATPTEAEQLAGITTSIPAGTRLLGTEVDAQDGVLTIDLSRSLFDVQGEELRNAFAQLVWTVTEVDGINRVRFEVDGEEYRVPDAAGVEQPSSVSRADYGALQPAG